MTIMKRLLLPFLLLGVALLPSGISAAMQGANRAASDQQASDLQVAVPTHGKPHGDKNDNDQAQEIDDDDKQKSEQTNVLEGGDQVIGDVIPIAAQVPVIPINAQILGNLVVDLLPLCQVLSAVEAEEAECENAGGNLQEMSQMRDNDQAAGNDINNQQNVADQEQEGESEQDAGQINAEHASPGLT